MITYTTANSKTDLEGILQLQQSNLPRHLDTREIESQGFVTVEHSYELLKKMNDREKHIIAKDNEKVIGYVLAMTQHTKSDIPVLFSMFTEFETVLYEGKTIATYNYLVVGQVCVDKGNRGQGIFDDCYNAYRENYKDKYDFAITEIAYSNARSLNAHKRIGFEVIHSYVGPDKTAWAIVLWNWKKV